MEYAQKPRIMQDPKKRVESGAAYLDLVHPGWWADIDLASLDLSRGCNCVLGQLYAYKANEESVCIPNGYAAGKRLLGLSDHDAIALGFMRWGRNGWDEFSVLEAHWVDAIKERWENGVLA